MVLEIILKSATSINKTKKVICRSKGLIWKDQVPFASPILAAIQLANHSIIKECIFLQLRIWEFLGIFGFANYPITNILLRSLGDKMKFLKCFFLAKNGSPTLNCVNPKTNDKSDCHYKNSEPKGIHMLENDLDSSQVGLLADLTFETSFWLKVT